MINDKRISAIQGLQIRYDPEPAHSDQVARLALQLFDELQELHQLPLTERLFLYAGGLLHDIGYAQQNGAGHHKNSLRIILDYGLPGFDATEVAIIANIARYHRKALPSLSHPEFAALSPAARSIVTHLSALLRIADGLDRSHRRLVHQVEGQITAVQVTLEIRHFGDLREEIVAAERKADLFRQVYQREIKFQPVCLTEKITPGTR